MQTSRHYVHPRQEIVETIERIYRYRMTTTSGGNVSIRDENGDIWITPARIDKGALRREDIVCCRAAGGVDGPHPPSSEYPFHLAVYRARPDIRSVVHAHPVALVAFSICRTPPNTALLPQSAHMCGVVGVAPYALPGSEQLGRNIADVFTRGYNCVLMENHGIVIGGATLAEAFQRFETLEFTAKTIVKASQIGPVRYLMDYQLAAAKQAPAEFPEFDPGEATTAEKEARRLVCDFVQRGYRQRLFTSTEGSFSARLGDDEFVITSYGVDRGALGPEELTLMRDGRREAGKRPSRAAAIHRAIYRRHAAIGSIANALAVNATAYSVSTTPLDARTIPESYIFLRQVGTATFAMQAAPDKLAELVSPDQPVLLLENNGALVVGRSVLETFDRLEVLESTAEALINSQRIGTLVPMDDAAIGKLIDVFLTKKQ
ncbi:MAG TPA: class II aldolase/adducin family protein [Tepidisphaeraceae bacterium]|jgi:L-fuculose-phosphate aldolase|nr:class II aldolase/adducin family protein [Tepidisphaeraceae bacterium]